MRSNDFYINPNWGNTTPLLPPELVSDGINWKKARRRRKQNRVLGVILKVKIVLNLDQNPWKWGSLPCSRANHDMGGGYEKYVYNNNFLDFTFLQKHNNFLQNTFLDFTFLQKYFFENTFWKMLFWKNIFASIFF